MKTKSSGLEKKKCQKEKRKERVKVQRELTKTVNEHFTEKAAISMLTECESKRKYHRKRMAQSFHSPQEQPPAKKTKTHSPDFSNVNWDKQKLQETIENWPADKSNCQGAWDSWEECWAGGKGVHCKTRNLHITYSHPKKKAHG